MNLDKNILSKMGANRKVAARRPAVKMRKFADKQRTDREQQSENSKTEATLILCGSSGERANNDE